MSGGRGRGTQLLGEAVAGGAGVLRHRPQFEAGDVVRLQLRVHREQFGEVRVGGGEVAALGGGLGVEPGLLGAHHAALVGREGGAVAQLAPHLAGGLQVVVGPGGLPPVAHGGEPGQVDAVPEPVVGAARRARPGPVLGAAGETRRRVGARQVVEDGVHAAAGAAEFAAQPGLGNDGVRLALPLGVVLPVRQDGVDEFRLLRLGDERAVRVEQHSVGQQVQGEVGALGRLLPAGEVRVPLAPRLRGRAGPAQALEDAGEVVVGVAEVQRADAALQVVEQAEVGLGGAGRAQRLGDVLRGAGGDAVVLFQGQPGPAAHRPGDLAQAAGEALVLQDQRGGLGDVVQPPRVGVVPVAALLEHPEEERGDGDQPVPFGLPDVDRPPDQPDRPVPARRVAPRARPLVQQPPEAVEEHRGEPLHVLGAGEQSVQLDLGRGGLRLVLPAGPEQEADEGAADPRLPRPGRLVAGALPGLQQRGAELLAGLLQRGPVGGDPAVHHEGEAVAVADQRQIAGGQRGVEHGPVVGGGGAASAGTRSSSHRSRYRKPRASARSTASRLPGSSVAAAVSCRRSASSSRSRRCRAGPSHCA
ncbi:hypothetical protein GCM10020295_29580 [Streptomyces cinereospinus]